jgi:hypothetical protein
MDRTFGVALGAELRREAAVGGHGELGDHHGAAGRGIRIHPEYGTSTAGGFPGGDTLSSWNSLAGEA